MVDKRKFLNVGGNNKNIAVAPHFQEWGHILLDIDPAGNPDVVCDARKLTTLPSDSYDAVYCSHNLEHYYAHDVPKVLQGFRHVLKPQGFVHIRVPDIGDVMQRFVRNNMDIDDILYHTADGIPILVRDVIYGWGLEIERSGQDFFAHKTGFTIKSLHQALKVNGFPFIYIRAANLEVEAIAFHQRPEAEILKLLGFPALKTPVEKAGV